MIRLSVSSYCLGHLPLQEALSSLGGLGYERLELLVSGVRGTPDVRQTGTDGLRALASAHGLETVALYPRPIDARSPAQLEASVSYIERTIDVAVEMGSGRIVFTPLVPRAGYDYDALAAACRRLAEHIGGRDVRVCLENHHHWPLSYPDDFARLFDAVPQPSIGITMDTGHFTASGVDLVAFADRIYHLRLKDHVGERSVPLGAGETDNAALLATLRQRRLRGVRHAGARGGGPGAHAAVPRRGARLLRPGAGPHL